MHYWLENDATGNGYECKNLHQSIISNRACNAGLVKIESMRMVKEKGREEEVER